MNVGAPVGLHLEGVKVVNGAQTVASIYEAMCTEPEQAGQASVWLRLISLENAPDGFAKEITVKTNTQNRVDAVDFVSLDEVQPRLRDEFALSLHKTYVIKRGDTEPGAGQGCTVAEAAIALACLYGDPGLVARAKQNPDVLYELQPRGAYHSLFTKETNAYRVWRSVLLLRAVRSTLNDLGEEMDGRGAQIAVHGDLAIVHLVGHRMNLKDLDNPDLKWGGDNPSPVSGLERRSLEPPHSCDRRPISSSVRTNGLQE